MIVGKSGMKTDHEYFKKEKYMQFRNDQTANSNHICVYCSLEINSPLIYSIWGLYPLHCACYEKLERVINQCSQKK